MDRDLLVQRMVRLLGHLTPREVDRLMVRRPLTDDMRVAICILIEDATVWHYDARDCPHYAGNVFEAYFDAHPEHGPHLPCDYCRCVPCNCDDEIPF